MNGFKLQDLQNIFKCLFENSELKLPNKMQLPHIPETYFLLYFLINPSVSQSNLYAGGKRTIRTTFSFLD